MNKIISFILGLALSATCMSQSVGIPDYDWKMNDINSLGLKKEYLFSKMDRSLIRINQSICSNRAHLWAYDLKIDSNIDASKIFLFYTSKTGNMGSITWWYHASPVINEKGSQWVMDAGFPNRVKSPLAIKDWLKEFTKTGNCKQLKASETDLIEHIFTASTFPEVTTYGKYDCYYKLAPAGYWTPNAVAQNLLGRNAEGRPVNYQRHEIDKEEVYAACLEAATTPLGRVFGGGRKKCYKYLQDELL